MEQGSEHWGRELLRVGCQIYRKLLPSYGHEPFELGRTQVHRARFPDFDPMMLGSGSYACKCRLTIGSAGPSRCAQVLRHVLRDWRIEATANGFQTLHEVGATTYSIPCSRPALFETGTIGPGLDLVHF